MAQINLIRSSKLDENGLTSEILKAVVVADADETLAENFGAELSAWLNGSSSVAVIEGAHTVRWLA